MMDSRAVTPVYVSSHIQEKCNQDAALWAQIRIVQDDCQQRNLREIAAIADRRLRDGFLVLRRGRLRIIAQLRDVNGQHVLCLIDVLDRGSEENRYFRWLRTIEAGKGGDQARSNEELHRWPHEQ